MSGGKMKGGAGISPETTEEGQITKHLEQMGLNTILQLTEGDIPEGNIPILVNEIHELF